MKKTSLAFLFLVLILGSAFTAGTNQILKTSLNITVLDELGNPVEGAKVTLYNSMDDYKAEKNPVQPAQTSDKKGKVKITGLEPKVYFVDARKDDQNNFGGGVQTDTLQEGRINKINIIIE